MTIKQALCSRKEIFSLYRSLLRESRNLPYSYLRIFYHVKFRDSIRSDFRPATGEIKLTVGKAARLTSELKRLQKANKGNRRAFDDMLDVAYGRKGKLWWELMESFTQSTGHPKPAPIIPNVESSRPPTYTPALTTLLTSDASRTTQALSRSSLSSLAAPAPAPAPTPASKPEPKSNSNSNSKSNPRSKPKPGPSSLGLPSHSPRISKRLLVNRAWRAYVKEKARVLPPLELVIPELDKDTLAKLAGRRPSPTGRQPLPTAYGAFQGTGLSQYLADLVGERRTGQTRREAKRLASAGPAKEKVAEGQEKTEEPEEPRQLPSRFLRRRHQELLARIPIMTYNHFKASSNPYEVSLHERAIGANVKNVRVLPEPREEDMHWIRLAIQRQANDGKGKVKATKKA